MKYTNTYKKVELIISEDLLKRLSSYGIEQFSNEFGGFLMGYYSNNFKTLTITDTVLPKVYQGTPYLFQRSIKGIGGTFEVYYKKQPNQYYIGEWHTHPNGSTAYSHTDKQAMVNITQCATVNITNPILLIISINASEINGFQFYLYDNNELFPFVEST
ncbi:Mov34/MPN/PAD-1 family protein [uncultured Lacinutrix sp.]|uniref:Mov34/MPN/PAD-1 family protein n=1 Tax=uncultured Lacinutrix sp. TaxID=574032 RepID=UPI00261BEDB4|nr:Mov34/MPN/PAD-1 family protein [uncultured Lacinutrix sp.]